ncbi:hypothetical protein GBAR_LOCUS18028, partial [Geodia barretti]
MTQDCVCLTRSCHGMHLVISLHLACHFTNLLVLFETGRSPGICQHGYIQSYRLDFKAHGLYNASRCL